MNEPRIILMVGLPGVGKSTFVRWNEKSGEVISNDDRIQYIADMFRTTYDAVWKDSIKVVSTQNDLLIQKLVKENKTVIVDMTNLTVASREKKFKLVDDIDSYYTKIVYNFIPPSDEILKERLKGREKFGKTIPEDVLQNMKNSFQNPTYKEDIDLIYDVKFTSDSTKDFEVVLRKRNKDPID